MAKAKEILILDLLGTVTRDNAKYTRKHFEEDVNMLLEMGWELQQPIQIIATQAVTSSYWGQGIDGIPYTQYNYIAIFENNTECSGRQLANMYFERTHKQTHFAK